MYRHCDGGVKWHDGHSFRSSERIRYTRRCNSVAVCRNFHSNDPRLDADNEIDSVRSRTIGSLQSARVSVPPLFIKDEQESNPELRYKWRTNLIASQPYWEGKFKQDKYIVYKEVDKKAKAGV